MTREEFDKIIEPAWKEWQKGGKLGIDDVFWIALLPYLNASLYVPDERTRKDAERYLWARKTRRLDLRDEEEIDDEIRLDSHSISPETTK